VAYDARTLPEHGAGFAPSVKPVTNTLVDLGGGDWAIDVAADPAWLLDPDLLYPVVIDPTLVLGRQTGSSDYFTVQSIYGNTYTYDNTNWNTIGDVWVEEWDPSYECYHPTPATARSVLNFDLGPVYGRTVTSATFHAAFSGSGAIRVGARYGWQEGTIEDQLFYVADNDVSVPMTSWVANWATGTWSNQGLDLWADQPGTTVSIASQEAGNGPYIDVTYQGPPQPVQGLTASAGNRIVTAQWQEPVGGDIGGYTVELWRLYGQLVSIKYLCSTCRSVSFGLADGLDNGWTYQIAVRATNAYGTSANTWTGLLSPTITAPTGGALTPAEVMAGGSLATLNLDNCARPSKGQPVDIASGEFWHSFSDLSIPGRGVPLQLSHTYSTDSSLRLLNGPLGHGWTFNYNMWLDLSDSSKVVVRQENGSAVEFAKPGFVPPVRANAQLVQNGDGTYTFTRRSTEIFVFNATGQLTQLKDLDGYTTTVTRPNASTMVVTDPAGRTLTFSYTGGHLTTVTDPMTPARTVRFGYDAQNDLRQVTDVGGGITSFTYDANHRMLTMRFPRFYASTQTPAPEITNHYDASGRVDWQSNQLGPTTGKTLFDHAPAGEPPNTTKVTDPKGNVAVYRFEYGLLWSETHGYGTPLAATWLHEYDPANIGCTKTTDPNGRETLKGYDPPTGNLTSATNALGQTTTWVYNSRNQLTSTTDVGGTTTTFTYDGAWGSGAGHLTRVSTPLKDGAGNVVDTRFTTYRYEEALKPGDLTSMSDPNHPYVSSSSKQWKYHYDAYGMRDQVISPMGDKTTWAYNNAGWPTEMVTPKGYVAPNTPAQYRTTYEEHDAFGRIKKARNPLAQLIVDRTYDANGNLATSRDAKGNLTSYLYDPADQLLTIDGPAPASDPVNQYWPDGSLKVRTPAAPRGSR
ncbi:MAG: DUF6531 domain-containing protein, partial [Acidimicrobiia bacterium]